MHKGVCSRLSEESCAQGYKAIKISSKPEESGNDIRTEQGKAGPHDT